MGELGFCVRWDGVAERWDVKLDNANGLDIQVRVKRENLETYDLPTLASNEGWCGRAVHSWIFADEQERVGDQDEARARLVSIGGEEIMTMDPFSSSQDLAW